MIENDFYLTFTFRSLDIKVFVRTFYAKKKNVFIRKLRVVSNLWRHKKGKE